MNLVERVKNILLTPRPEWEVIDGEPATPASLYTGYIIPLAAIGPLPRSSGIPSSACGSAEGCTAHPSPPRSPAPS